MSYKNDGWHEVMCDDLMFAEIAARNPSSEPPVDSEKAGLIFYNDEIKMGGHTIAPRAFASAISQSDANAQAVAQTSAVNLP